MESGGTAGMAGAAPWTRIAAAAQASRSRTHSASVTPGFVQKVAAQPVAHSRMRMALARLSIVFFPLPLGSRLGRRRGDLPPAARALWDIGVIALGVIAIVPVRRGRRWGDHDRRVPIRQIIIRGPVR